MRRTFPEPDNLIILKTNWKLHQYLPGGSAQFDVDRNCRISILFDSQSAILALSNSKINSKIVCEILGKLEAEQLQNSSKTACIK